MLDLCLQGVEQSLELLELAEVKVSGPVLDMNRQIFALQICCFNIFEEKKTIDDFQSSSVTLRFLLIPMLMLTMTVKIRRALNSLTMDGLSD